MVFLRDQVLNLNTRAIDNKRWLAEAELLSIIDFLFKFPSSY